MKAHFRVIDRLDMASGGGRVGTVTIDREGGLFIVRPYKRRITYVMPLAMVATMVCQRIIANEVVEKRRAKAARKKGRKS
jgi:hypothetical protein